MSKYKIRNFPGVKMEHVGKVLSKDEVIEMFSNNVVEFNNESLNVLVDNFMIEKVEEEFKLSNLYLTHRKISQHQFDYVVKFRSNKEITVKFNGNSIEVTPFDGIAFAE